VVGVASADGPDRDQDPPSTPTELRVITSTESSIALEWAPSQDNVGVTSYEISGDFRKSRTKDPDFSADKLSCGTSFAVSLVALDRSGNRSDPLKTTVATAACQDTTAPSVPSGFRQSATSQDGVVLIWDPSTDDSGVVGYGIYREGTLATTTSEPSVTLSGLACGSTYRVDVDAYDAAGNHSARGSDYVQTAACSAPSPPPADTTAPSQPTALSVASATQTSVSLVWAPSTDNVGVAGYDVYRNTSLVTSVAQPGSTVSGLSCGTAYTLAVDAYDSAGNRSGKASVTGTTAACADTQAPTAPAGVQATSRTTTSIALSWSASSDNTGVVGYGLYQAGTLVGTSATTTGIFSNLTCNTNYTLAVDAYDAAGNRSSKTTVMVATTACVDTTPPLAPTGLAVSNVSQTGFTLGWTPSSDNVGVTGYDVYKQNAKVGSTAASTSYAFANLTCGTSYTLGVVAFDAAGNRSVQSTLAASTSACAPASSTQWPTSYFTGPAGNGNILPPKEGVLVGIWDNMSDMSRILSRESQVGRKFDIGAISSGEAYPVNVTKLRAIRDAGRIPMITMNSNRTVGEINAGAEDAWHVRVAQAVKDLGVPTFVKLYHEFNGSWMPYYTPGDTAADGQAFINAWRHVVSIYKAQGATNAVFVWAPHGPGDANAKARYPGDAWVDWVGNSSYTNGDSQWSGFYQGYCDLWRRLGWAREYKVSNPTIYNDVRYKPFVDIYDKPFMIAEMGHFADSRKAQYFRNAKANLLGTFDAKENGGFPNVLALMYSDYVGAGSDDWRIDSPSTGLDGFRDMVNDPYFKTRG
jgi:chitodextrinase